MSKNEKFDLFKMLDPTTLLKLENLNLSNILKQLEQLKLSGLLEKIEDLNKLSKLMKEAEDIKLSELVKKIEDIRLSNIIKQIEENKLPELLADPLKMVTNDTIHFPGGVIKIETKTDSIPDQIKKLSQLRDSGIITNEEFQTKKKQLLDKM